MTSNIGIFDENDGIGLGWYYFHTANFTTSNSLQVFVRKNGVTTHFPLNGTSPSDPTKFNEYRIIVTDKVAGIIRFDFYNSVSNQWVVMHTISNAGSLTATQLRTLHLPISATVTGIKSGLFTDSAGTLMNASLQTSGWSVCTKGDIFETKQRAFSKSVTQVVGSPESHLLTLQNNNTFGVGPKNNWVAIKIKDFLGYSLSSDILSCIFKIYKNATVTGATFTQVDPNNSVISTSDVGTYIAGTGTEVYSAVFSAGIGGVLPFNSDEVYIQVSPGETLTITSQLPYNPSANIFTAIRWMELF